MDTLFSRRQILANIMALLSGTALSRVLSAVILIVIARQLGVEAYGQYSATIALIGLIAILFSLGLDKWLLYQGGRERDRLDLWYTSALSLLSVLGGVWLIGSWVVSPCLNQSTYPWILVFLGSLSLWLEEASKLNWSAFKACLRNDLTSVLMIFAQGAFLVVILYLAFRQVDAPAGYMAGRLVAMFLGAVVAGYLVVRRIGARLELGALRTALRGSLPFAASNAFTVIYGRADLAIIGNQLGKVAAGVYAPALTLTNTLFLIPAAVQEVMLPILSKGYATDRVWTVRASVRLSLVMVVAGVVLGTGLAWLSQPLIDAVYGHSFWASGEVLKLLSDVLILRCPTIALSTVLVAVGWQTPRVGVQAVAAVLNVVLNLLVVHSLGVSASAAGVMGVAQVYVLTEGVLLAGHLGLFLVWLQRKNSTVP